MLVRLPVRELLGFAPFAWKDLAMLQFLKGALDGDILWEG